jgi:hypothetical protein
LNVYTTVFWGVMSFTLTLTFRKNESRPQSAYKMEAVGFPEPLRSFNQITRRYIPRDSNLPDINVTTASCHFMLEGAWHVYGPLVLPS